MNYILILLAVNLVPVSFAAAASAPTDLKSFLGILTNLINILIPFIFALTFLTIAWGVLRAWVMGDATSEDLDKGKKIALVGVIALVIMSAIWGILNLLKGSLFG
jgi:hypothetical protein